MSAELQQLRAKVAELKAAPIFSKAAIAEQAMDVLIAVISQQQVQINLLRQQLGANSANLLRVQARLLREEVENGEG